MSSLILNWDYLASIGNSKFIKSSYIWLFIVPVAAKGMSLIEDPLDFSHLVPGLVLDLELPFSWVVFYASAIFFALGNIFFQRSCPGIIARYPTLKSFLDDGRDFEYLLAESVTIEIDRPVENLRKSFKETTPEAKARLLANAFWMVRAHASIYDWIWIRIVFLHFMMGMLLLGWIFGQNFLFVLHQTTGL